MRECEYYQELMSRLLDGDLTAEEEAAVREHVRVCPDCRQMFAAFTGMTGVLREDLAEPPKDLARGVMERIADEADEPARRRRQARRPARSTGPWVRLSAAACLVLIAAGGVTAILHGGREKSREPETVSVRAAGPENAQAAPEEDGAMVISTQDGPSAADTAQAAPENAAPPSPAPEQEALPVYDAARNRIGVIPVENIPAFAALTTDAGWGDDGPPDIRWEYLLKVDYQGKTYAFATDPDSGTLVWWVDPSPQVSRSPGQLADLHELITTESPALPE